MDTNVTDQITRFFKFFGTIGTLMPSHTINLQNILNFWLEICIQPLTYKTFYIFDLKYIYNFERNNS